MYGTDSRHRPGRQTLPVSAKASRSRARRKASIWQAGPAVSSEGSRPLTWLAVACHMPIRIWSGCAWNWTGAAAGRNAGRGLGRDRAGGDRQGRGPAVRAGRAGRRSCGAGSWGCGWAARACRWISGTPRRSRRGSATRCCCGTGTASGPAAAPSPPAPARCTTPGTRPTAGRRQSKDCVLLCPFHHQIVIHRWGWTLVVNPDGTTSAWNKNKTKVLHSHGPPARAG